MATIILKRGIGTPTSLQYGEFGYDTANKILYIGREDGTPIRVFADGLTKDVADASYYKKDTANVASGYLKAGVGGKIAAAQIAGWSDVDQIIAVDHVHIPGTSDQVIPAGTDIRTTYPTTWNKLSTGETITRPVTYLTNGGVGVYYIMSQPSSGSAITEREFGEDTDSGYAENKVFISNVDGKAYRVNDEGTVFPLDQMPSTIDGGTW